ncbi:MAG: hypothetical protein ACQEQD_07715 [Bacillota bacterium]
MDKILKSDIEELISGNEGPCVSLYMPTSRKAGNDVNKMKIRMKNLIKKASEKLKKDWDYSNSELDEFLKPLNELLSGRGFWLNQSLGLAVYLSGNELNYYRLPINFKEEVDVEKNYVIKQLLPELFEDRKFYILTLSKNSNRFFESTKEDLQEIELKDSPDSIEDTLKYDDPEKTIQYHSNSGNGSAIYHGQGVTDEDNKEDFMRYLREIDEAVYDYLHNRKDPLVVMCVEEVFPLYKKANSFNNLLDEFIKGSPDKISKGKILNKAWEVVKPHIENYKIEAINKYKNLIGSDKIETNIKDILKNSFYGKIDSLFIQSSSEKRGFFDREKEEVKINENKKSIALYNEAAIQTIINGGEVYILDKEEMPTKDEIAAIYRY